MRSRHLLLLMAAVFVLITSTATATAAAAAPSVSSGVAPGAPGQSAEWLPADKHGFGTSTTFAQLIRLAWSMTAGHPVEQPAVVACRYVRRCAAP